MYQDNGLILASAETIPTDAVARLNAGSVTAAIDRAGTLPNGLGIADIGPTDLELAVDITTSVTSGTAGATLDFRLVSLHVNPTKLTSSSGRPLTIASVAGDIADADPAIADAFTVTAHGLPLGTPIFFSSIVNITGITASTVYFVVPVSANTFHIATTMANALAGTIVDLTGADGTVTVNFIPYVHASTSPIQLPFLTAGNRLVVCTSVGHVGPTSKLLAPYSGATPIPLGATNIGTTTVPTPGRYLGLMTIPSAAITAGAFSASLGINTQLGRRYPPSGFIVQ